MNYSGGKPAMLGDRVKLWDSMAGTIVCSIDDNQYSPEFSREDWAYKGKGVVVKADNGQIFYYDEADEDFEFLGSSIPERVRYSS